MSENEVPSVNLMTARALGRLFRDLMRNTTGHEAVRLTHEFAAGQRDDHEKVAALPLPIQFYDAENGQYVKSDHIAALVKTDTMFLLDLPFRQTDEEVPVPIDFERHKNGFHMAITDRLRNRRMTFMIHDSGRVEILTR